ncbi:MAG: acetolactate synthase small subunit [Deltaproteobacteria bacterium]|nr:acetolactate synthase small subunit [Deltaproteobacteria bacterium]
MTPRKDIVRTFVVYVEDRPGVLNRAASLFRRRGFNIESLNVGQTHVAGVSRMTVTIEADDDTARRIEANLYKLVNVLEVQDITHRPRIERELALIKVRAAAADRAAILQIAEVFQGRVVDMSPETLVLEITGSHDRIQGLVSVLETYGIEELVQTGSVAMTRGSVPPMTHLGRRADVA